MNWRDPKLGPVTAQQVTARAKREFVQRQAIVADARRHPRAVQLRQAAERTRMRLRVHRAGDAAIVLDEIVAEALSSARSGRSSG